MVDDDEYAKIVESRRNEDEFVVDDSKQHNHQLVALRKKLTCCFPLLTDGLGYHDDGEEHLGIGEDAYDGKIYVFNLTLS